MKSVTFTIPADPVPFARAGSFGKRRFTPAKQTNFMNKVQIIADQAMSDHSLFIGPVRMEVEARYMVPASWSQKKRDTAKWKTSRPDLDNLTKLCADAINGVVFVDDAQIVELVARKVYGDKPETQVTITEV